MKRIGLLAAMALLAACTARAQLNGVTAELKLVQDQYLPGEDLQLKVRILNRSGQEITLGTTDDWINLTITGENGSICSKLGDMPLKSEFSLLPGEVGTRTLNPTPYFDIRQPGRYQITAQVRIPQWQQEIACKPAAFTVANGVPLPNLSNLQFGLPPPPGVTNAAPEVRRYSLLKVNYVKKELKLYFRLADSVGRTLHVFPIARLTSFSDPEAQIDRYNNLNVLVQTGARAFSYCVLSPEGQWVVRQTHVYTNTRPELRIDADGKIFVAGGARRPSEDDLPPPPPPPPPESAPQ
jgi:hypothetical protein